MLKVIDAVNLIGDSIYCLRPIQEYLTRFENTCLVVSKGLTFEMFHRQFGSKVPIYDDRDLLPKDVEMEVIRLEAGVAAQWCHLIYGQTGRKPHISEGFAFLMGVEVDDPTPLLDWIDAIDPPKEYITICPFSRSCSRHSGLPANKTLDDWKWNNIISYLRRQDIPVKIMGAPGDRLTNCAVPDNDYLCANGLSAVQLELKKSHFVISVDSGLGHLSSCLNLPTIILWPPAMPPEQIAPLWAPRTMYMHMNNQGMPTAPNSVSPAHILFGLRKFVREILDGRI